MILVTLIELILTIGYSLGFKIIAFIVKTYSLIDFLFENFIIIIYLLIVAFSYLEKRNPVF